MQNIYGQQFFGFCGKRKSFVDYILLCIQRKHHKMLENSTEFWLFMTKNCIRKRETKHTTSRLNYLENFENGVLMCFAVNSLCKYFTTYWLNSKIVFILNRLRQIFNK